MPLAGLISIQMKVCLFYLLSNDSVQWDRKKLTLALHKVYNHVLRLDLQTLRWELVDNYGDIPGVRMGWLIPRRSRGLFGVMRTNFCTGFIGHTANLYQGDKLVVFGGENEHRGYLSDVVILDLSTSTWTQPEIRGHIPRGRARHAAVIHDDKLFITGGVSTENSVILDDISCLDLKTWTWSRTWSFAARFDHTAWVWDGRLWISGGIGSEMERTTDIWWLDLRDSPSLGFMSPSQGMVSPYLPFPKMNRFETHGVILESVYSPSPQLPGRYAANSGSVQVRNFNRRKPTAPGTVSCLRVQPGAQMPSSLSGTHYQVYAAGTLLDLFTPSETVRTFECGLTSLQLDTLRWQKLADGPEIFTPGYRWHYCIVDPNGTTAWLLGCSLDNGNPNGAYDDNHMDQVLCIDLTKFGLVGGDMACDPTTGIENRQAGLSPVSSLGADLAAAFDKPPESGSGTDFIITADPDDQDEPSTPADREAPEFLPPDAATSLPIHVHRIILQLRWSHFKRLYSAQMAEYHSKRMHIPEPYSVVRAFLYYLYTDSISGHPEYCADVIDVAGMLVMSNIYDMPKLRLLCVNRLSREISVESAAVIWERAGRTNEGWLMRRAAQFCLACWGRVVRSDGFKSLSRQSLIDLCEMVDTEGRVIGGPELEMVTSAYGAGGLGASREKRSRLTMAGNDVDDYEAEDVEGMEIIS